jgi:peptidoglycan L-alanyl-D-glutamate endopeptidase CwlK
MYTLGTTSKKELSKVNQLLQYLVEHTITGSTIDFGIVKLGGIRTAEEQHQLYLHKVSKCDGVKNKSYHQSGNAIDIIPYVQGKYTWNDKEAFKTINTSIQQVWVEMDNKQYNLCWGGNWKTFIDMPHYELRKK